MKKTALHLLCGLLLGGLQTPLLSAPVPVSIERTAEGFQLLRDGKPYFIRGAGTTKKLEVLQDAGGNSLRTWGADNLGETLDRAESLGMTVAAGLWIHHQRHGADYTNPAFVEQQLSLHKEAVLRHKDHPALLLWGIGNEIELHDANPVVWNFVEKLARFIKEVDPHHPVMSVTAFINENLAHEIKTRAPSLDLLGINAYGGLDILPRRVREVGWEKPYLVAEWGPDGMWEVDKTPWGAEIEATTTEAAAIRLRRHNVITSDPHCLGGYVFLWGQKQETTPTWFSMFTKKGEPLAAVDTMHYLWKGQWPEQRAPATGPLRLNGKLPRDFLTVAPQALLQAELTGLRNVEKLTFRWELLPEHPEKKIGGDPEKILDPLPVEVIEQKPAQFHFQAPATKGDYRLFVYAINESGKAASANFPFLVE